MPDGCQEFYLINEKAMKRIVHEEQSQREIQLLEHVFCRNDFADTAPGQWCEDFVRESWNRPPSSVQLPGRLSGQQEMRMRNYGVDLLLIRVVPPKPFGPLYRDEGAFFM